MNAKQETLLQELRNYAVEVRNDWSDFDGRDLLQFINEWIGRFHEASEEK